MRGIRKLLTWIALLIIACGVPIFGVRAVHPAPASTACIQLLSPTTGDVLTVDATTGASRLDARVDFPVPITEAAYRAVLSPDHNFVLNVTNVSSAGPDAFHLWLGRRSTTVQRALTPQSHAHQFIWSPDSRYLAFMEMRGLNAQTPLFNLALTDTSGQRIRREAIPKNYDDSWLYSARELLWSPDSRIVAVAFYHTNLGATLALRPADLDTSIFVPFHNQKIIYFAWSPDSQFVLVVSTSSNTHTLSLVQPDGRIFRQITLAPNRNFEPTRPFFLSWSPDGQYFYVLGIDADQQYRLELFNLHADRLLTAPLPISPASLNFNRWSNQPHTLIYLQTEADLTGQSLYAMDVATQQTSVIIADLSSTLGTWSSSDRSSMLFYDRLDLTHGSLRLLSRDLSVNMTLFANMESYTDVQPVWSPDNQYVAFITSDDTSFQIIWQHITDGNDHRLDLPRTSDDEQLSAAWITNSVISLTDIMPTSSTFSLIDATTAHILPKFTPLSPSYFGYYVVWNDERYAAVSSNTNMSLYRLSDGSILFDNLPPGAGPGAGTVTLAVEPNERALLIYRDRDSNFTRPTISLITDSVRRIVMNADFVTLPAWSADGETFTFAAIEKLQAGWTVKVMSRDGILLNSFPLPADTSTTPYQQVRWTNCG